MFQRRSISILSASLFLAGASLVSAAPKDKPKPKHEAGHSAHITAKVGEKAPEFTLKDTDGKEHRLSDYTKRGKTVVLTWFNPECPFIKLHYEKQTTVADIHKDFGAKNVQVIAIDSTHSGHANFGKDADAKSKWKLGFPVLIDADGKVGRIYGAKTTPHNFVIDKNGTLAYAGAMDDDARGEKSAKDKHNYVRAALDDILAGKKVATAETKPYGCSVKYKD